uniref:Oxidized low-density lipoprotein receptor 1 n=1 Tax=Castor canadensis TaxID=51338 RepID=A0A8B7UX72_CASCN|nr:oxidized low-density lipoprotein receptor 1 [Castor canadensis]
MSLEMTFDDLKMKPMKDQPNHKSYGEKAKGLRFLSSLWWCPATMTLGIICLGLLVIIIMLGMQLFQVSELLKQCQANLTHQEDILEGQVLAQEQAENTSQQSQRELKEMIKTLAWKLDEKSKKEVELHQLNLDLQEALRRVKNFSGLHLANDFPLQFPILDRTVSEEAQLMALGGRFSLEIPLI